MSKSSAKVSVLGVERVVSSDGKSVGRVTGGTRQCGMESCGGTRIGVRWPDGQLTWPCTKGMRPSRGHALRIIG